MRPQTPAPVDVKATITVSLFQSEEGWAGLVESQGDLPEVILLVQASNAIRARLKRLQVGDPSLR